MEKSCPLFKEQINADLGYFRHASGLLDRAIDSIRGIVEIEQAQSDRAKQEIDKNRDAKLQNTIQSVGIGLGVSTGIAGIFAQTFPLIIEKNGHYPARNILFSLHKNLHQEKMHHLIYPPFLNYRQSHSAAPKKKLCNRYHFYLN